MSMNLVKVAVNTFLLVLFSAGTGASDSHRLWGKSYDSARDVTICKYRMLGDSSPERTKLREVKGKAACPGKYVWDDEVEYPDEEGTYLLNSRTFDAESQKTTCAYREVGGTLYKMKVMDGDTDCPNVYF